MPEIVREQCVRGEEETQIAAVQPVLPGDIASWDNAVIPGQS